MKPRILTFDSGRIEITSIVAAAMIKYAVSIVQAMGAAFHLLFRRKAVPHGKNERNVPMVC